MNQLVEFLRKLFYKPHSVPVEGYQSWVDVAHVSMCFFIVLLHVAAPLLYVYPVNSLNCQFSNLFYLVRFAIPVFVMVSGYIYLTLKQDKPLVYFLSKALHLWVLFYVWHIILASFSDAEWFLNMLAILLMLTPLFQLIIKRKIWEEAFLICGAIAFVLFHIFSNVYSPHLVEFYPLYGVYFVAGHYLATYPPKIIVRRILYVVGLICAISLVCLTGYISIQKGQIVRPYDDYISIFWAMPSLAVFLFIKTNAHKLTDQTQSYFARLAPYTLGIYLLHTPMAWDMLRQTLTRAPITTLIWIPWMTIMIFFTCAFLTKVLMKIPFVRYFMR